MADIETPLRYIAGANTYTFIDPRYEPGAAPSGDLDAWDVRNWVNVGETWDQTGTTFVNAILQRAINALNTQYLSDGIVRQVYIPNGIYRIGFNITCKSGVGIKGQSELGVTFNLESDSSFIGGVISGQAELRDCHFETFTVDGIGQTASAKKGFYAQNLIDCSWRHVTVRDTRATGFGVDHLDGVRFDHCTAVGCGRDVFLTGDTSLPGRSGFGLGSGMVSRNREAVSLIGCVAIGNGKFGIFIEKQSDVGSQYAPGYKIIGCHMEGNLHGYGDVGASGAIFVGNTVMDQRTGGAGVLIGSTTLSGPGIHGLVADNLIAYNPVGIKLGATPGPYTISNNEIRENTGDGVQATVGVLAAGMTLRGNRINANGGVGFKIDKGHTDLTLDQNVIRDNTGDDVSMTGAGTVSGLTVRLNDFRSSTVTISQTITTGLTVHDNLGWTYP